MGLLISIVQKKKLCMKYILNVVIMQPKLCVHIIQLVIPCRCQEDVTDVMVDTKNKERLKFREKSFIA